MEPKVITTQAQYETSLAEVERLVVLDPVPGTDEADKLALLATLVEQYETKRFQFEKPTPVQAIKFRMEEQSLLQADLVPYIGSSGRVSEVLSEKRPLTLAMIRRLSEGLGIPADILIQDPTEEVADSDVDTLEINWSRFPFGELKKRGYLTAKRSEFKDKPEEVAQALLSNIPAASPAPLWKRTLRSRMENAGSESLIAWVACAAVEASKKQLEGEFVRESIDDGFRRKLAQLSCFEDGPRLAVELLSKHGIALVFVPHFQGTLLDGGAFFITDTRPVIGLTLRHDRLDNFWFVLIHELVHIERHLGSADFFLDNIESEADVKIEKEADRVAMESFIPRNKWRRSDAYKKRSKKAIIEFARELGIHPAIIAGRLRYETGDYTKFTDLLGQGEVQKLFDL